MSVKERHYRICCFAASFLMVMGESIVDIDGVRYHTARIDVRAAG